MAQKKKRRKRKWVDASKFRKSTDPRLTRITRDYLNLIHNTIFPSYFKSDATSARMLKCNPCSIRRSRDSLSQQNDIIAIRTRSHTWSVWSVYDPRLWRYPVLWTKNGETPNPFYRGNGQNPLIAHFALSDRAKCAISFKNKNLPTGEILNDNSDKGSRLPADTSLTSGGAPPEPPRQSATPQDTTQNLGGALPPQTPPAVQGKTVEQTTQRKKWDQNHTEYLEEKNHNKFMKKQAQEKKDKDKKQGD